MRGLFQVKNRVLGSISPFAAALGAAAEGAEDGADAGSASDHADIGQFGMSGRF